MMVLVLDKLKPRLNETVRIIQRLYPEYTVTTHDDPLAAVQFVYYNPVDCVIVALDMRPMNGVQYIEAARKVNDKAKMILMAREIDLDEFMIFDDEADGFLFVPLTEENIRTVLSVK